MLTLTLDKFWDESAQSEEVEKDRNASILLERMFLVKFSVVKTSPSDQESRK